MPELTELWINKKGGETKQLRLLSTFKDDLRNPVIGHGFTLDEGAYRLLAERYETPIRSLYDDCLFMSKYQLMAVEKTDFSQTPDLNEYQSRVLMGAEIRFNLVSWSSNIRLFHRQVYLRRRDGEVLSVHPFLLFKTCDECMADRLFLLENVKKHDQELLLGSVCGHDSKVKRTLDGVLPGI